MLVDHSVSEHSLKIHMAFELSDSEVYCIFEHLGLKYNENGSPRIAVRNALTNLVQEKINDCLK